MKHVIFSSFQFGILLVLCVCLNPWRAWGQCENFQITHLSGTQQIGCNEVTVTEEGSCSDIGAYGYGPYWIGETATGSYIFTFSTPVPEVRVSLAIVNDVSAGVEEVSFEVNGNFYPITNPDLDDGCRIPCIISGTGTIRCGPGDGGLGGSWQDIIITGNITTLKITDTWLSASPNGSVARVVFCCPVCPTDAGTITANPLNLCPDGIATVPTATQPFLDNDDLLQYILFSDLNDTLGSIISTSNTPSFVFTSAIMQLGTSYYIAAIAGNNIGGCVPYLQLVDTKC